jgi:Ca-activated chloride channel homolog
MAFTSPHIFWLLCIVPVIILLSVALSLLTKRDRTRFAEPHLYLQLSRSAGTIRRRARYVLFITGMVFLVLALTRPRFGTRTEIIRRMGVDVVIALDTSYSMLAEDVKPNRLRQAKYEIARLIDNLQGDRVGVLAFSGRSFVQCPLTTDYAAAKTLLDAMDVGIISEPGTDIADALKASIALLEKGSSAGSESQLVILFTDGESLKSDPATAAKDASLRDISVFTVGIGTPDGEVIPIRSESGEIEDYKKDSNGKVVTTSLDEDTLRSIARSTGGSYLRSSGGEVDIQVIIDQLGSMHKADIHERKISRLKERYQIPLGFSLACFLTWLVIGERRRNKNLPRERSA